MNRKILTFIVALTLATDLSAQTLTVLHSFTWGSDGAMPQAGLILSDNTLYGTAYRGGSSDFGSVFKVNTDGTGFTILHSFTTSSGPSYGPFTNSDGAHPIAGLVLSGNTLYGTAVDGGSSGSGTVFKVNTDGTSFATLYNFTATISYINNDGANPHGALILSDNILYGTADYGGSSGNGTVFAVHTDGSGFTKLHNFSATSISPSNLYTNSDGAVPLDGLFLSGSTLYGTANGGGSSGNGTVFKVNTDGTGFTTLHNFTVLSQQPFGTNSDGFNIVSGLILSGNTLYGTAPQGGSTGNGTVFKVNTDGTGFMSLYNFTAESGAPYTSLTNSDGASPNAGLFLSGSTLYGTATGGGGAGYGTIFAINTDGNGFVNLHSFTNGTSDGESPLASLILSGNTLYGTTCYGGSSGGSLGSGTVFALSLGSSAPIITTQPQSQTVQVGSNVTLNIVAKGQSPLRYQWFFNGSPVVGQTAATLSINNVQLSNGGNYSVTITNAYGSTNSAIALLTVFAPLTLTPTNRVPTNEIISPFIPANHLKVFQSGKFRSGVTLNKSRMTIVMTHGFMSSPDSWATNMATFILAHVSVPTPNIVAWDWSSEAGTKLADLPVVSAKQPLGQGFALATNLLAALGTNYSQRIHFIGHSLGTLVNSAAANYLHDDAPNSVRQYFNPTNTRMTLFDEAEAGPEIADALVALQNHQQVVHTFYGTPIPTRAAWIDNYISAFGLPHPEAANVVLIKGAVFFAPNFNSFVSNVISFHGYPYVWYGDSVTNSASGSALMGYRWSFEKNNFTGMPATNTMFIQTSSNPELTLQQTNFDYGVGVLVGKIPLYVGEISFSALATAINAVGQIVGQVSGEIQSTTGMIINLVTGGGGASPNVLMQAAGGASPNGMTGTNAPAYVWMPLAVPPNTVSMSFDFMLQGNGSNDNFEVALNGTNVLSLATGMIQTNVMLNSGLIDVSKYAGTNVELFLGIVGGTSTNASLTASGFLFYSAAQPSLQAQVSSNKLIASWPVSAAGFTLQTSTNLTATNSWTTVTNVPAIVNLQNEVTNSVSDRARFYRLKQ